jgi:hypothetical protein
MMNRANRKLLRKRWLTAAGVVLALAVPGLMLVPGGEAQAPTAPRISGTVKSLAEGSLVVSAANGTDYTVGVPAGMAVMEIAPGSKDLSAATKGPLSDVAVGDRVMVMGSAGDTGTSLQARRVIVMKATAIAASNASIEQAWQRGGGGLVKSVDPAAKTILVANGDSTLTVEATPATIFKRYSGSSVRFEDAVGSSLAQVQPGDQLRVRGERVAGGTTIRADEIVTGAFRNLSGLLTAVNASDSTVTLNDLATKSTVTVKISPQTDMRRLPPQAAARLAARARGQGVSSDGTAPGSTGAAASGPGGSMRAGADLSGLLTRLPTETLGGLKAGDAVMIVANAPAAGQDTAVTLLVGVDPILRAAPKGEMTLTPWSVGGGADAAGGSQ